MAKYPDVQDRARREVLEVMNDTCLDAVPTNDEQKEFQYLSCVIKETMRVLPPVGILPMRVCKQDTKLGNLDLPKGTAVNVDIYALHHSNYENGDSFNPERFWNLIDNKMTIPTESNDDYKWLAFGGGTRICIGMQFSLIEQRCILAMILRNFRIQLNETDQTIQVNKGILLNPTLTKLVFKPLNVQ
jgi:cytochrome P450